MGSGSREQLKSVARGLEVGAPCDQGSCPLRCMALSESLCLSQNLVSPLSNGSVALTSGVGTSGQVFRAMVSTSRCPGKIVNMLPPPSILAQPWDSDV